MLQEDQSLKKIQSLDDLCLANDEVSTSISLSSQQNIPKIAINSNNNQKINEQLDHSSQSNNKSAAPEEESSSNALNGEDNKENSCHNNKRYEKRQQIRSKGRSKTYKIERQLGNGCSAVVYLANDSDCENRQIAVKKFKKSKESHFEIESKILQLISQENHPNIIKVSNINEKEMEIQCQYYSQGTLLDLVQSKKRLNEQQARFLFKGICNGMQFLKTKNICHRDLKLQNILLDEEQNPIIIDFGFAKIHQSDFSEYLGTEGYQAPEIVHKKPYCGYSADSFSLGVILFEMLIGKRPFKSANIECGHFNDFINDKIKYWEGFEKDYQISDEAKNLINNLISPDPSSRLSLEQVYLMPWMSDNLPCERLES